MKVKIYLMLLILFLLGLPIQGESAEKAKKISNNETVQEAVEAHVAYPHLPRITAEELKKLMDEKGEYVLVDAQDSASYGKERISGAINISYDPAGDPMIRDISLMALPMDKLIIVYCNCEDDGTSAGLVMEMFDLGFDLDNVRIVSRGIIRWKELGYPVVGAAD